MSTDSSTSILKSSGKLYRLLLYDKQDIVAVYMLAVLAGFVQLSLPLGIQTIVSFVMAGSISTSIITLTLLVVLGTFMNGVLQVRQLEIIEKLKQKIFLRFGLEFSNSLPQLNLVKLDGYHLPELVNRFFDTISLQKGLEKLLLDLPAAFIQILFGLLLLSFYHPVFIGFGVLLITIIVLIVRFTSPEGLRLALKSSDYKYKVLWWLQETASLTNSFKYSPGNLHITKTDALIAGHLDARTKYFRVLLVQFWSLISFKVIITAAMLIVGTILLVNQQINVGQFIAADIVIIAIIASVEKLVVSLDKVYDALVSVEKLGKITEAEKETGGTAIMQASNKAVSVRFEQVSFGYHNGDKVLDDVSFHLEPGKWAHVTGKSGSGKSTLLKLLTGSYKDFKGSIVIDGKPINNYELETLRSSTGILLSSQEIFEGSLWENITMGDQTVSPEEVTHFSEKLGLLPFVQANHNGFDMQLKTVGKRLPKHIRQRILLVRALMGKHRLLLLEEPFEYLEPAAIDGVVGMLKNQNNTTVIIAAEDPAMSAYCDVVINLGKQRTTG